MSDMSKVVKRLLTGLFILLVATSGYARPITLYDAPKDGSKVVGTLDSDAGVITIFTPKESLWTKVADPRNGNVGWIKSSDLGNTGVSFNVITSGDGTHGIQLYQYGGSNAYSSERIQKELKAMEQRHRAIQENIRHMMDDMFGMFYYPSPIFVPVVVVPEQKTSPHKPVTHQTAGGTAVNQPPMAKLPAAHQ